MASRRLGDLPVWVGLFGTIAGLILSAGIAWGAADARLNKHDKELGELNAKMERIISHIATLLERTKDL